MNGVFAIGIPTVNRYDLLNPTLLKYSRDFPETRIIIIDNGNQPLTTFANTEVITPGINYGFSKSINIMLDIIYNKYGCNYALLPNDDIYFGKKEEQVKQFMIDNDDENLITTTSTWCNFILPYRTYKSIGGFDDKNFFNYFSDNDYAYRLKLAGLDFRPSVFMNPEIHLESMSIKKDPSLNEREFDKSKQNYILKWGGMPGSEQFTVPFNGKKQL